MPKLILNCFNLQPVVPYIPASKSKPKFTFLDWNTSARITSNRQKKVMPNSRRIQSFFESPASRGFQKMIYLNLNA